MCGDPRTAVSPDATCVASSTNTVRSPDQRAFVAFLAPVFQTLRHMVHALRSRKRRGLTASQVVQSFTTSDVLEGNSVSNAKIRPACLPVAAGSSVGFQFAHSLRAHRPFVEDHARSGAAWTMHEFGLVRGTGKQPAVPTCNSARFAGVAYVRASPPAPKLRN
jgi:hypothetical protein